MKLHAAGITDPIKAETAAGDIPSVDPTTQGTTWTGTS